MGLLVRSLTELRETDFRKVQLDIQEEVATWQLHKPT